MTPEQIKERLKHANLKAVAEASGLHYNSVYRFMNGGTKPAWDTVNKLEKYLERQHG
ncbi:transcriptional regulator [Idiomarinaceae phage 1N2-2]|uniref:transcriptional regulator n=1 Tax=Idiomarinaceae phage 1N2-2 TaxID=1536592 RepID=UPI0004F7DB9C|nr:transcriptional regulator [Idiomarinaceae phage 1N2-2]AIM40756.1 putative HTH transcription regulator, XRE family [Idiomarinaceae phage 1N2-2]